MVLERIANPSAGESWFLSSSLSRTAKFCKCQQEKVTLQRFLRRTDVVEGKWVQLPTGRLSGTGADWLLRWIGIPSDGPPTSRLYILG